MNKSETRAARAPAVWERIGSGGLVYRIWRFALVSGVGLALDVCIFTLLVALGLRAGLANLISACAAVSFVYFASTRRIFAYKGQFLLQLFLVYLGYQVLAVTLASWAVDALARLGVLPVLAKLLILPGTFSANYVFMSFLTKPRSAAERAASDPGTRG